MADRFEEAYPDPSKCYDSPKAICADDGLDDEQKIKLLKQWEYDLRELQVAADENMTPTPGATAKTAECLQEVRECLRGLSFEENLEKAAVAHKQGGG